MASRTFTLEELTDLDVGWDNEYKQGNGARRWSENFDIVFRAEDDGKLYFISYEEGLTEYQDYTGSDRYPDMSYVDSTVVCPEVELYTKQVPATRFRKVA